MSSCPGLLLENYLMWNYNLIVAGDTSGNASLEIAEAIGTAKPRPELTHELFAHVVRLYEPWREMIEGKLEDFDEETQSWRDYAGAAFQYIPEAIEEQALDYIRQMLEHGDEPMHYITDAACNAIVARLREMLHNHEQRDIEDHTFELITVELDYTNYRRERSVRRVIPMEVRFGSSEYHPYQQWLMDAWDLSKKATRTFAMRDIHSIRPAGIERRGPQWPVVFDGPGAFVDIENSSRALNLEIDFYGGIDQWRALPQREVPTATVQLNDIMEAASMVAPLGHACGTAKWTMAMMRSLQALQARRDKYTKDDKELGDPTLGD